MEVDQLFEMPPALAVSGLMPSPPGVIVDITRMVNNADTTVDDLAGVIETDPVLVARMLATVNSSLYNLRREIHSIPDTVMLLGFRAVRSLALGVSVSEGLPDPSHCPGFDTGNYWRRSLMTAVLSRDLGVHIKRSLADEAFTVGLISNIGRLVIATAVPQLYAPLLVHTSWPDAAIERAALGFDSATVTAAVLHGWGLPDSMCFSVGHLADPDLLPQHVDDETKTVTQIVGAASSAIATALDPTEDTPISSVAEHLAADLGLQRGTAQEAIEEGSAHLGEVKHLIAKTLPAGVQADRLITEAQKVLHQAAQ